MEFALSYQEEKHSSSHSIILEADHRTITGFVAGLKVSAAYIFDASQLADYFLWLP